MTSCSRIYEEYAAARRRDRGGQETGHEAQDGIARPRSTSKNSPEREGLSYEVTPSALARASRPIRPDRRVQRSASRELSGGRKFADEFFDPKKALYEPEELTDLLGTRFLARKIKDVPSARSVARRGPPGRQPRLEDGQGSPPRREGRSRRWPSSSRKRQTRSRTATVEGYRVVTIPPITRLQTNFLAQPIRVRARPRKPRSPTSPTPASRSEKPISASSPARWPSRPTSPAPSITSWSPSVVSRPPSPRSMPPTVTSYRYKMSARQAGGPPAR